MILAALYYEHEGLLCTGDGERKAQAVKVSTDAREGPLNILLEKS